MARKKLKVGFEADLDGVVRGWRRWLGWMWENRVAIARDLRDSRAGRAVVDRGNGEPRGPKRVP